MFIFNFFYPAGFIIIEDMAYAQKQRFHPAWILTSLLLSLAVVAGVLYRQEQFLTVSVLAIVSVILLLHGALLAARLQLIVNEDGIRYRFFPFHLKPHKIYWFEVEEAKVNTFNALLSFGGWGIRYHFFYSTKIFIARSGTGLFIQLKNGRRSMFSISKPEKLEVWLPLHANVHH